MDVTSLLSSDARASAEEDVLRAWRAADGRTKTARNRFNNGTEPPRGNPSGLRAKGHRSAWEQADTQRRATPAYWSNTEMTIRLQRSAFAVLFVLTLINGVAFGQTTTDGDVLPGSFPFTDIDIGVTSQSVNVFLDPTADQPDYERGDNIQIGRTAYGLVRVSGGDDLRWEHLILGGTEDDLDGDDVNLEYVGLEGVTSGQGVMRLEQLGTSFNNHPLIIPTQYQDIYPFEGSGSDPEGTYFAIPADVGVDIDFDGSDDVVIDTRRDTDAGFDAIIGLTGSGELFLNTGARMEIQDAFIVGYAPGSSGYVELDGVGTYLGVYGGLNPNATMIDRSAFAAGVEIHQMIIGAYGDAEMRITGGADVDAFYGAAIGTTRSDGDHEITESGFDNNSDDPQGAGRVIVDGAGSTWNIAITVYDGDTLPNQLDNEGGALAIGEYDANSNGYEDEETGQGYLSIRNDAQVNVTRYVDANHSFTSDDDADVRIGLMGTLDFRGGSMTVMDQLVNDGVIQATEFGFSITGGTAPGGGTLEVGTFENRALGEVVVSAGQKLTVIAKIPTATSAPDAPEALTSANHGLMEVIGDDTNGKAELEYIRHYEEPVTPIFVSGALRSAEVFYNAGEASAPGQIVAQDAILRFRDGLWNSGNIQFIGGDNIVSGPVMNAVNPPATATADSPPFGSISVANGATVVFEDAVVNDGQITLSDDSNATFAGQGPAAAGSTDEVAYHGIGELNIVSTGDVHIEGNFALGDVFDLTAASGVGGVLRLAVEDFTRDAFSHLVIEGDADFDFGTPAVIEILELAPPSGIGPVLTAGDEFEFITVLGTVASSAGVVVTSLPASGSTSLAFVPEFDENSFSLIVVEDQSTGADFNGDGIVDAADVSTWEQYHGLQSGAAGVHGDVDLDGDVDTTDYAYMMDQYGGAGVVIAATVPSPTALALLSTFGLFTTRRRR